MGSEMCIRDSPPCRGMAQVWALVERTRCLRELMDENDKDGKSWVLYAAEAGNPALFDKIRVMSEDVYTLFNKADKRGWNGFMYTVRRRTSNLNFLKMVCAACFASRADAAKLEEQLTRVANDDDRSTLLMHSSIGGRNAYNFVCSMMSEIEYAGNPDQHDKNLAMLCWAAQGGDITVLNMVAEGIKVPAQSRQYADRTLIRSHARAHRLAPLSTKRRLQRPPNAHPLDIPYYPLPRTIDRDGRMTNLDEFLRNCRSYSLLRYIR